MGDLVGFRYFAHLKYFGMGIRYLDLANNALTSAPVHPIGARAVLLLIPLYHWGLSSGPVYYGYQEANNPQDIPDQTTTYHERM